MMLRPSPHRAFVRITLQNTNIRLKTSGFSSPDLGQFLINTFLDEPGVAEIAYTYKTNPLPNHRVGPTPKGKARL